MEKFKRKTIATNMSSVHFCKIMAVVQTQRWNQTTPIITVYRSSHESCGVTIHQHQKEKGISITTREERSILSHRRFMSPGYK
jgi:hypothetical protein